MYIRPVHAELDVPTLQEFIRKYPLGLFTTSINHPDHPTIQTTHIPFVLDVPNSPFPHNGPSSEGDEASSVSPPNLGTLRGHMARANPQTKVMISSLTSTQSYSLLPSWLSSSSSSEGSQSLELKDDVLILFQAPTHSYVTPSFYVQTKPSTGKVAPTWDYAAVQVYGRARIHHQVNEESSAFLQKQIEDLTHFQESASGREKPWSVAEAPEKYVELLKKGIIGLEIKITRIEGRFKLGQELPDGDWLGAVQGFRSLETAEGAKMAEMIEERGKARGLDSSIPQDLVAE